MKPSDSLYYKRVLIDLLRNKKAGTAAGQLLEFLTYCQNFYVTADMTAIARAAGASLPLESVSSASAFPTREGFMVFDAPIGHVDFADGRIEVTGVAWQCHWSRLADETQDRAELEDGTTVSSIYETVTATGEDPPAGWEPVMSVDCWPLINAAAMGFHALIPGSEEPLVWRVGNETVANEPEEPLFSNVLSAWLLMQQSLTVVERASGDRPERRRYARLGLPAELLIVRLRRLEAMPKPETGGDGPDWSHRWLVSGHWRQQYYPSQGGNSPIWINPHVKGPADRPLIIKERVTAWVR